MIKQMLQDDAVWIGHVALTLKELQVEKSIDLVYGGGSIGLMGLVSQVVFDGGRHVLG